MNTSNSIQPTLTEEINKELVDLEWYELLITARDLGITPDEIRNFLSLTMQGNDNKFK